MQLFASSAATGRLRLDPRTKILMVIVVNIACLTRVETGPSLVAFACTAALLASIRSWRSLTILCLMFAAWRALQYLGTQVLQGPIWATAGATGFFLSNFTVVLFMGVYLARSTTPSELIEGLRRLRAPRSLIIPLAVMLRFFPTLVEELTAVVQAVRLRRLDPGPWELLRDPLTTIEHIMVPFLVSATRIGDELAAAALTRGLGSPHAHTTITRVHWRRADLVGAAIAGSIAAVFIHGVIS